MGRSCPAPAPPERPQRRGAGAAPAAPPPRTPAPAAPPAGWGRGSEPAPGSPDVPPWGLQAGGEDTSASSPPLPRRGPRLARLRGCHTRHAQAVTGSMKYLRGGDGMGGHGGATGKPDAVWPVPPGAGSRAGGQGEAFSMGAPCTDPCTDPCTAPGVCPRPGQSSLVPAVGFVPGKVQPWAELNFTAAYRAFGGRSCCGGSS